MKEMGIEQLVLHPLIHEEVNQMNCPACSSRYVCIPPVNPVTSNTAHMILADLMLPCEAGICQVQYLSK